MEAIEKERGLGRIGKERGEMERAHGLVRKRRTK
jgi:hypothetical protein